MPILTAFFAILALIFTSGLASAAEIYAAEDIPRAVHHPYPSHPVIAQLYGLGEDDGGYYEYTITKHIRLEGEIEEGDLAKLEALVQIDDFYDTPILSLNSQGGSYAESLRIADFVSDHWMTTIVLDGDRCLSACAFVFMAGTEMYMRGVTAPSRILSMDADLGFHAPFSNFSFGDMLVDTRTMDQAADFFYSAARDSIRLLQERMTRWQLSTDFVFQLLGYGRNDFLFVDRAANLYANPIDVSASSISFPENLTIVDAFLACELLMAYEYGFPESSPFFTGGQVLKYFGLSELGRGSGLVDHVRGMTDESIALYLFYPQQGNFPCEIARSSDQKWRATLGEAHTPFAKLSSGLVVNNFTRLGLFLPWNPQRLSLETEALEAKLEEVWVPEEFHAVDRPSFDCGAARLLSEQLICENERLSRLDGAMGALSAQIADTHHLAEQREWLRKRDRGCLLHDEAKAAARGREHITHCLALMTMERVGRLSGKTHYRVMDFLSNSVR